MCWSPRPDTTPTSCRSSTSRRKSQRSSAGPPELVWPGGLREAGVLWGSALTSPHDRHARPRRRHLSFDVSTSPPLRVCKGRRSRGEMVSCTKRTGPSANRKYDPLVILSAAAEHAAGQPSEDPGQLRRDRGLPGAKEPPRVIDHKEVASQRESFEHPLAERFQSTSVLDRAQPQRVFQSGRRLRARHTATTGGFQLSGPALGRQDRIAGTFIGYSDRGSPKSIRSMPSRLRPLVNREGAIARSSSGSIALFDATERR
jgi:hypothetical protein